ncbi:MAG: hypothetical protein LLG04_10140 [Parachlamydia sp.]|nr:hypothetical protein [Parachlamydia sp.]
MATPVAHCFLVELPNQSKEAFLADMNRCLHDGRYHVAAIEDLRAKRFQKAADQTMLTEQNLAPHVLVEAAVFNNPNQVRYYSYRQDHERSGFGPEHDTLDIALYYIDNTRRISAENEPDLLIASKIEAFRSMLKIL